MSEDPTPTESNLTAEQIAKAKLQDAAPIACHIDLRKNLAIQQYREADPTPEASARDIVKRHVFVSRGVLTLYLTMYTGCTPDRATRAINNEIRNGHLIEHEGNLTLPTADPLPSERSAWATVIAWTLLVPLGVLVVVGLIAFAAWVFG